MKKGKKAKKIDKKKEPIKHMFSSQAEYIDYAYGSDPILCQALKNCCEE